MKDIYTRLAELHEAFRKDPAKEKQYRLLVPLGTKVPVEVQVNCGEAVLAGKIREAAGVVKNLGREHNGQAQELRESAEPFAEAISPGRTSLQKHLVKRGILSEAEATSLTRLRAGEDALGKACTYLDPAIPAGLSESQRTEFKFAKAIGFNDEQAMAFVKTPTRESRPNRF